MNEKMINEFCELLIECNDSDGIKSLEKFRDRRKRMWCLAGYFDFFGLKNRSLESNTLNDIDMILVSYMASLVCLETILRRLETKDDALQALNN